MFHFGVIGLPRRFRRRVLVSPTLLKHPSNLSRRLRSKASWPLFSGLDADAQTTRQGLGMLWPVYARTNYKVGQVARPI